MSLPFQIIKWVFLNKLELQKSILPQFYSSFTELRDTPTFLQVLQFITSYILYHIDTKASRKHMIE